MLLSHKFIRGSDQYHFNSTEMVMSDISGTPQTGPESATGSNDQTNQRRRIMSRGQFIKDLSFENPNAGKTFGTDNPPKIDISVSVNGRAAPEDGHEVEIQINAKASINDELVFIVELLYGGTFVVSGIPVEQLEPVVMIECPRLLFPLARRIIADCSRDGGYPPLMLEPIDFAQMYLQRKAADDEKKTSKEDDGSAQQ